MTVTNLDIFILILFGVVLGYSLFTFSEACFEAILFFQRKRLKRKEEKEDKNKIGDNKE